jgi:hypothetical protein
VWFFLVVLPALTLPWSAWLPAAVRRLTLERSAPLGLYAWWVVAIVGFFSLPSSKLVGYALPALAPWCALLALALSGRAARLTPWVMGAAAIACVAIVGAVAWNAPGSNRALALALAERMARDDTVVMVDEFFYDVPFYARLQRPVLIASRWDDPDLPRHDNWRKELFDAARFDPALGRMLLRPRDRLDTLTCGAATVWFIATPAEAVGVSALAGAARVFTDTRAELWRVPGRTCP